MIRLALVLTSLAAAVLFVRAFIITRRRMVRLRTRLDQTTQELEELRRTFSRFTPDEVIERVIASGTSVGGEKREVTVLFADLVGFTALSEELDAQTAVELLNGYFEAMSEAVATHGGYVAKFIGDGILAFFGTLTRNPWQADDAARAALAMREALAVYNDGLVARGLSPLACGIGIQKGQGVAGLVGSQNLKEFTVVGSVVNVANRVQDLTRQFEVDILLTEAVRESLSPEFKTRALPATPVRGLARPLEIHALEGSAS